MNKLEMIAWQVKVGRLDVRSAAFMVVSLVERHKAYFMLQTWNSDDLSDFLFEELGHFERMLERYDPRKAHFSSFFYKGLRAAARSYLRRKALRRAEDEAFERMKEILFEEQDYRYVQDGGVMSVENACSEEELRRWAERSAKTRRGYIMNTVLRRHYHSPEAEKLEDLRKSACLILFLKSSAVADDSTLRSTSIVTGISEDRLFSMMTELKEKLDRRMCRRRETASLRDDAFFLHRKYQVMVRELDSSGVDSSDTDYRCSFQGDRWMRHNVRLENGPQLVPSNRDIAEILNVTDRKVAYILKMARKKLDAIRMGGEDG